MGFIAKRQKVLKCTKWGMTFDSMYTILFVRVTQKIDFKTFSDTFTMLNRSSNPYFYLRYFYEA